MILITYMGCGIENEELRWAIKGIGKGITLFLNITS